MQSKDKAPTSREGLTWPKTFRFLSLPFNPKKLKTYLRVKRFEDIPLDKLLEEGIEGVLLDADGTLGPHDSREFHSSVINHVRTMIDKNLKVAIYTNAKEDRFQVFTEMGVKIVLQVPAKPDVRGFHIAMTEFLQMDEPSRVCMIGDNYVTDGGAVDLGMHFIHVKPLKGNEPFFHSATRFFAYLCAKIYNSKSVH